MSKSDKMLEKMQNNPRDWQIADFKVVASRLNIKVSQGKGSHVSFSHSEWDEILTVPAHRPIKSVYVKKFISLINTLK